MSIIQYNAWMGADRRTLAGELGFEPRQTESESVVLPLHHSPKSLSNIRGLAGNLRNFRRTGSIPSKRAPFYSLGPGLGKRAAMAFLPWACGGSVAIGGADRAAGSFCAAPRFASAVVRPMAFASVCAGQANQTEFPRKSQV